MNKKTIYGIFLLFITATVWGVAFVAQSVGMDYMNAFAFNCLRNIIGVMVLLPVLFYRRSKTRTQYRHNLEFNNNNANHLKNNIAVNTNHKKNKRPFTNTNNKQKKDLLFGGFVCGTALCIASNFQQLGIQYSTVGKSAFITTLYIVFVPIFGLFLKKKVSVQTWIGVILAMIGLYLLCMKDEAFVLGIEDIYLLLSAVFFTFQIMFVDYYVTKTDGVALSMMQFLVTAILSGICMIFTEIPSISDIIASAIPLLYAGGISCGVGYTLQIIGQKYVPATLASLIMSLESVIAALAGWFLLHEVLSPRELLGCILVFIAVILTQIQIPFHFKNAKDK